jgi:hypothetical protein
MRDAGINDNKPYHIKHATISWLHKQGVSTDQIVRFIRHALGSTTYLQYYLSEDLGEACTRLMERTALPDDRVDEREAPQENEVARGEGDAWESTPLGAIARVIDAAASAPAPNASPKHHRSPRSSK